LYAAPKLLQAAKIDGKAVMKNAEYTEKKPCIPAKVVI
jgi:hypothetical protein